MHIFHIIYVVTRKGKGWSRVSFFWGWVHLMPTLKPQIVCLKDPFCSFNVILLPWIAKVMAMRLIDYIEERQRLGKLWFTKSEALAQLGCTKDALKQAIYNLIEKKRLVLIRGEFVLIIPFEFKGWGIVPADYFIDPLMKYLELPYYIALLSAGQLHGAAHQKPMQFQVMTNQYLREIKHGRIHVRFMQNNNMTSVPTQRVQVKTGYAIAATPEATAFDLCKYYKASGYWNNVGTVLMELIEVVDSKKLCQLATSGIYDTAIIQRLGYILSRPEIEGASFATDLYSAVQNRNFRWVPLNPEQKDEPIIKDDQWKILINENIEVDL